MPIFDYQCAKCDARFELLVRGDTRVVCPSCGAAQVEKLLSVPARAGGGKQTDFSGLGPPAGGCCGGGGCGGHSH